MKRLVVDLDYTITADSGSTYAEAMPNHALIAKLRAYKASGFEIVISTSRNMRTFEGNVGKINLHTVPGVLEWLARHEVPCDELHVAKPWCGTEGFYVDDRAVRPAEFVRLSYEEILDLIDARDKRRDG
jgi:capsule biosynthesis phosphatase